MDSLRTTIPVILLFIVIYYSFQIQAESKVRQADLKEHSEIRSIKYGLLSVHEWKRQVSEIIAKKVKNFKLTDTNRTNIRERVESILYGILDELEAIIEMNANGKWGWVPEIIRDILKELFFNVNGLRNRVPQFTEIIVNGLDNYETREKIRKYIQDKIEDLLFETIGHEDLTKVEEIKSKYSCSGIPDCGDVIQQKLEASNALFKRYSLIIIGLSTLAFFILFLGNRHTAVLHYFIAILFCIVLLLNGISTPMIDIDARISQFDFLLMGEEIGFSNQILFFQSKSILEVIKILIATSDFKSILVAGLIFIFSVIFPILKLIASALLTTQRHYKNNRLIHFLAIKSGKWSLADVVVVAIFMSYIGFKGILENQLAQIANITANGKIDILTTDNSDFGVGFILFLWFCLSSIALSAIIEKRRLADNTTGWV